jgi:hypothetical protein
MNPQPVFGSVDVVLGSDIVCMFFHVRSCCARVLPFPTTWLTVWLLQGWRS